MSEPQQEIRAEWSALFTWNEEEGTLHFSCEEYPYPKGRPSIVIFGDLDTRTFPPDQLEAGIEQVKLELAEALKHTLAGMTFAPADEDDEEEWEL